MTLERDGEHSTYNLYSKNKFSFKIFFYATIFINILFKIYRDMKSLSLELIYG